MRTFLLCVFALASTSALALDDKYKPVPKKEDPVYNSQTRAAAAEVERRKTAEEARKSQPLVQVPLGNNTSARPAMVGGNPGVVVEKKTP